MTPIKYAAPYPTVADSDITFSVSHAEANPGVLVKAPHNIPKRIDVSIATSTDAMILAARKPKHTIKAPKRKLTTCLFPEPAMIEQPDDIPIAETNNAVPMFEKRLIAL